MTVWFVAALAAMVATIVPEPMALDIDRVLGGEWWRLATGHFVHLSWRHYLCDMLALGLSLRLCSLLEKRFSVIAATALFSASAVSILLVLVHPVEIYGGMSGLTAGLLSFAVFRLMGGGRVVEGTMLLSCMLVRLCLERYGVSASDVVSVWQAHWAGAVTGMLVAVCLSKRKDGTLSLDGAGGNREQGSGRPWNGTSGPIPGHPLTVVDYGEGELP